MINLLLEKKDNRNYKNIVFFKYINRKINKVFYYIIYIIYSFILIIQHKYKQLKKYILKLII